MKRVGILGGGQLGSLLSESILRLGGSVAVYDSDKVSPGFKRTPISFNGSWTDEKLLAEFFDKVDVVTYDFENVDSTALPKFEKKKPIMPSVNVLKITQDRAKEKTFLSQAKLPHVDFHVIESIEELRPAAKKFGYPFILKTARGGYDGKGQFLINSEADLAQFDKAKETMTEFRMVLERLIDIHMELSCIVARSPQGEEVCFPVFENAHAEHILDVTVVPARISEPLENAIREIALNAARQLDVNGLLTTEFFLSNTPGNNKHGAQLGDWHIYINEFAPRPHNSGHVTMKACTISQYDALARILLGVPLVPPRIVAPGYYCMANLLGDVWLAQGAKDLDLSSMKQHPNVIDIVFYGKEEARSKRKMGHFITYATSAQAALDSARAFRQALSTKVESSSKR